MKTSQCGNEGQERLAGGKWVVRKRGKTRVSFLLWSNQSVTPTHTPQYSNQAWAFTIRILNLKASSTTTLTIKNIAQREKISSSFRSQEREKILEVNLIVSLIPFRPVLLQVLKCLSRSTSRTLSLSSEAFEKKKVFFNFLFDHLEIQFKMGSQSRLLMVWPSSVLQQGRWFNSHLVICEIFLNSKSLVVITVMYHVVKFHLKNLPKASLRY